MSIQRRLVRETPISVIDLETTGLNAGSDRVVEVSVVRVDPRGRAALVFDTLVNPQRQVAATEIHGITDRDVADAPTFREIAGDFVRAIAGSVIAAYNVYFDIRFLRDELRRAGVDRPLPHLCFMYMRPMLDLGPRCSLEHACREHGVAYSPSHHAADDAAAAAGLMPIYSQRMLELGVETFADLAALRRYKFVSSFAWAPVDEQQAAALPPARLCLSRAGWTQNGSVTIAPTPAATAASASADAMRTYLEALKAVVADSVITDLEVRQIAVLQRSLGLKKEQLRVLHASLYASVIANVIEDQRIEDAEVRLLRRLRACLSRLGWAPGD